MPRSQAIPTRSPDSEPRCLRAHLDHVPDDFVSRDPKLGPRSQVTVGEMQVSAADATDLDTDEHLEGTRCGLVSFNGDEPSRTAGVAAHCPAKHGSS